MSELVPIFVVWIVFYYTYKLIGLYARRKERLLMIEKMNAVGDVGIDDKELFAHSFTALRVGCLLIGVGIGLLIGVIIQTMLVSTGYDMNQWADRKLFEISLTACVLLFGGLGLLVSYPLERKFFPPQKD